jgi:TPP-dependent pyruvate/acetoin dehydrogenase alpha subunit
MQYHTPQSLVAFENRIRDLFEQGELPFLLHLAGGNERQLVEIFAEIQEGDWVFSNHRAHFHALLAGIPESRVEQLIRDGRSMFIFDRSRNFVTSAILAGTCGIAAGVALALKQAGSTARVWCFLGDGAEDSGHAYEAIRFVDSHELPCTFIIEDNDRQVDTPFKDRWGTSLRFDWRSDHVIRYRYTPTYPHAGRGAGPTITFKPEVVTKFAAQWRNDGFRTTRP